MSRPLRGYLGNLYEYKSVAGGMGVQKSEMFADVINGSKYSAYLLPLTVVVVVYFSDCICFDN